MKNEPFDRFDTVWSELLQGREMPSAGFTARVMARVKETPQEQKKAPVKRRNHAMAAIAACAAVLVLCMPFLASTMQGSKDAADAAHNDNLMMSADTEADGSVDGAENGNYTPRTGEPPQTSLVEEKMPEPEKNSGNDTGLAAFGQSAGEKTSCPYVPLDEATFERVSAWLDERGCEYAEGYTLDPEAVAALCREFTDLTLPEGGCILVSE